MLELTVDRMMMAHTFNPGTWEVHTFDSNTWEAEAGI